MTTRLATAFLLALLLGPLASAGAQAVPPVPTATVIDGMVPASRMVELFKERIASGYRVGQATVGQYDGKLHFNLVWEPRKNKQGWYYYFGLDRKAFDKRNADMARDGLALVQMASYRDAGTLRFAGLWLQVDERNRRWRADMSAAQYQAETNRAVADGFRPVHLAVRSEQGVPRFDAIWLKAPIWPSWEARHDLDEKTVRDFVLAMHEKGYGVTNFSAYDKAGQLRFALTMEKGRNVGADPAYGLDEQTVRDLVEARAAEGDTTTVRRLGTRMEGDELVLDVIWGRYGEHFR